MIIALNSPSKSSDLCPKKLIPRSFSSDVVSTAKSFKSWDTCMDKKACKIIAIVGIVIAGIVLIWLIGTLAHCLCSGVRGISELFCWCIPRRRSQEPQVQTPYNYEVPSRSSPYGHDQSYPEKPTRAYDTTRWNGYSPVNQAYSQGVVSDHKGSGTVTREKNTVNESTSYRGYNY